MEALRTTLCSKHNIISISHVSERVIFTSLDPSGSPVLTFCDVSKLKSSSDNPRNHFTQLTDVNKNRVGRLSVLNPSGNIVYTTLENNSRIASFPFESVSDNRLPVTNEADLRLESSIHALNVVGTSSLYSVIAVSRIGELGMVLRSSNGEVYHRPLDRLSVESVLSTCIYNDNHLIVFANHCNSLVLYALDISLDNQMGYSNPLEAAKVKVYGPLTLPIPPTVPSLLDNPDRSILLATLFNSNFAAMLFVDGTVSIVAPTLSTLRVSSGSLKAWFSSEASENRSSGSVSSIQTMTLTTCPSSNDEDPTRTIAVADTLCTGDISAIGKHYVAIAYGQCLSVWDTTYFSAHGFLHLSRPIHSICTQGETASLTVADSIGVHSLTFSDFNYSEPPSLTKTIRLRQSCNAIISIMHPVAERSPIHGHTPASALITAAADAGGDVSHLFERTLRAEQKRELHELRVLLSPETTLNVQGLYKLARGYIRQCPTKWFSDSKETIDGQSAWSKTYKIPSDRFASAFVARCLYEMAVKGNCLYTLPLIDMIETGVVSADGVLSALEVWCSIAPNDDKDKKVAVSSIARMVIESGNYFNVLEALVFYVVDISEEDMVRIAQFAARHYLNKQLQSSDDSDSAKLEAELLAARAVRLLHKCFTYGVDKQRILQCLAMVPFDDVIMLLLSFKFYLHNFINGGRGQNGREEKLLRVRANRSRKVSRKGSSQKQDVMNYRGVAFRHDSKRTKKHRTVGSNVDGCLEWIGHVLDAQFSNLVMDSKGQKIANELLKTVQSFRRERDVLGGLKGIVGHLVEGRLLPDVRESTYCVRETTLVVGSALL